MKRFTERFEKHGIWWRKYTVLHELIREFVRGTFLEIITHEGTVENRKSLCRKGLQDLEKVQKTQNANRMLTVFPKSE